MLRSMQHETTHQTYLQQRLTREDKGPCQALVVPNGTIYPAINELTDLQGYELHTAFVPDESDRSVIGSVMQTLADDRNGSLVKPMGLQAASLMELSRRAQWQFSLVTVGPLAYATCFFVPRAVRVPIGYILVGPFDTGIWIGVLVTASLVVLLLKRFGQASRGSLVSAIVTLLQSVLTSPNRISRSAFERRILTACSLGCVVLVSSYQSMIFSLISNPAYYPELDTEQQINRSCSLLVLVMDELGGIDTFRDSFFDTASFRTGESCVCTTCRLERVLRRKPQLAKVYRASRHRTHPFPMLISLVDRHYPPLNELVERYVSGFFEAGLTVKLMMDRRMARGEGRVHFRAGPSQQLRVSDLHIVWLVLKIGLASAFCCFLAELASKHWKTASYWINSTVGKFGKMGRH
uniref:Ionotropic glutamate receptor C-terminal domain-containing protein n=1 Tax=Anopheles atroparvus TaxID=41427 RepID=A0A182JCC9_ANOAO